MKANKKDIEKMSFQELWNYTIDNNKRITDVFSSLSEHRMLELLYEAWRQVDKAGEGKCRTNKQAEKMMLKIRLAESNLQRVEEAILRFGFGSKKH